METVRQSEIKKRNLFLGGKGLGGHPSKDPFFVLWIPQKSWPAQIDDHSPRVEDQTYRWGTGCHDPPPRFDRPATPTHPEPGGGVCVRRGVASPSFSFSKEWISLPKKRIEGKGSTHPAQKNVILQLGLVVVVYLWTPEEISFEKSEIKINGDFYVAGWAKKLAFKSDPPIQLVSKFVSRSDLTVLKMPIIPRPPYFMVSKPLPSSTPSYHTSPILYCLLTSALLCRTEQQKSKVFECRKRWKYHR